MKKKLEVPPLSIGGMLAGYVPVIKKEAVSDTMKSFEANRHKPCTTKDCPNPRAVSKHGICIGAKCFPCIKKERDKRKLASL